MKLYKEKCQLPLYNVVFDGQQNKYKIVSSPESCRLMASPEVVGYDAYLSLVPPTKAVLETFAGDLDKVGILNILRGGLNYPIEESCHLCGIPVSHIDFLSSERIIRDGIIEGLAIKYEKVWPEDGATIIIGDIIASGITLKLCLEHITEYYKAAGKKIRKFVIFTIGGTKAISLLEEFTAQIRSFWSDFEGFECIFYEGIFSVYESKGIAGINTPDIDFGLSGGIISPEFREYVCSYREGPALLEKCIIYDGGARRYNIEEHFDEVHEYWESLEKVSGTIDFKAFVDEKLGYELGISYDEWLLQMKYDSLNEDLQTLYQKEMSYAQSLLKKNLKDICINRF